MHDVVIAAVQDPPAYVRVPPPPRPVCVETLLGDDAPCFWIVRAKGFFVVPQSKCHVRRHIADDGEVMWTAPVFPLPDFVKNGGPVVVVERDVVTAGFDVGAPAALVDVLPALVGVLAGAVVTAG